MQSAFGRSSLVLPSSGVQRPWHRQPRPTPARALSEKERDKIFDTLCSERFVDRAPAEVVATLLDEDVYLCSERTMYRVLDSRETVQERRAQRSHPEYKKPELMATGPNQVWSWDITRLLGPKKWSYFYLYVIWTSSAATSRDGWWRIGRTPPWPAGLSNRVA